MMRAGSPATPSLSMAVQSSETASLSPHEQQANQDSGAGSSDHRHADERQGHGHRERQPHRRYPRGPDPEGSGLFPGAIHSRKDVDMTQLQRTVHQTYCPYKGECAYFSIPAGGERSVNAVWSYEAPYVAVSAIREYLAFYPDRIDAIEIESKG